MENDVRNAERTSQNFAFEKRSFAEQIDRLEELLEQERTKNSASTLIIDTSDDLKRSASMMPYKKMESLLVATPPTKIDLDSFKEEPKKVVPKTPTNLVPDLKSQIIIEVPEEDKNSNFGYYGTESESAESDE